MMAHLYGGITTLPMLQPHEQKYTVVCVVTQYSTDYTLTNMCNQPQ